MRAFNLDRESLPGGLPDELGTRGGGVYAFVLRLGARPLRMRVGALGVLHFKAGYYCYAGSARRGLKARLERHLRRSAKKKHWHVDYLRQRTEPVALFVWTADEAAECELSQAIGRLADESVRGFGATDCSCLSHLHYFPGDPRGRLRRLRIPG